LARRKRFLEKLQPNITTNPNPIRKALRKQLKDLGKRLFRLLGNTEEIAATALGAIEAFGMHIGEKMDAIAEALRKE
jgi:hypothetical protein